MDSGGEIRCIQVQTSNFTAEWVIDNVSTCLPQRIGQAILSPDFYTNNTKGDKVLWYLRLELQGDISSPRGFVSIYLFRITDEGEFTKMKLHVQLCTSRQGTTQTLVCTYKGTTDDRNEEKIEISKLLKSCATLKIICKIDIPGETLDTTKCMMPALDSKRGQWHQDFRPLFNNPKFSDVSIIVGTQKFLAHKLVLAARSSVFSAMFDHEETQENIKKEVKIEEMEPAVVEAMLEFFYTDEVKNLEGLACELLGAAEKYDVPYLRSLCEESLYKTLNNENAAKIFVYTDLYRSHELKEHVMKFMLDHLSDVVESDSYKEMEEKYPALLKDLVRLVALQHRSKKRKLT